LVGLSLGTLSELHKGLGALQDPVSGPYETAIGTPARYFDVGQVPLIYAGRSVGRLILLRDISHRKEAEDRLQAAMVELEKHQQQLREESIRDMLTGLHNRRFLDELGPILLAEAKRSDSPLAAVMLDIDHFKRLNDTYGHQAGDTVLRASGAFLREQVRQSDAAFRMGGEEFLILLPHTEEPQAERWVEELRGGYMALAFAHDGLFLNATVSVGFAMYPADADGMPDLLHRADMALYRAKTGGRNRVCRWQTDVVGAGQGGPDSVQQ
jgi:diguanylate cyclase (GGDEF)-like protein